MSSVVCRVGAAIAVVALGACGSSATSSESQATFPSASPDLQCDGEYSGSYEIDADGPISTDPDEPAVSALEPSQREYGGEIVALRSGVHALVVDGRRVLVARSWSWADGYVLSGIDWCDSYFDQGDGSVDPPHTEAPVPDTAGSGA